MIIKKSICILFAALSWLVVISQAYVYCQEPKDILAIEAFDMLNAVPDTYLIDVRTRAEYQFAGHPPMAYLFPYSFFTNTLAKEGENWMYRFNTKNKSFLIEIYKKFQKTNNIILICRDGIRSKLAARELIKNGFRYVYNVKNGFEGSPFPYFEDENKNKFYRHLAKKNKITNYEHRRFYGWLRWGLPWTYEMDMKYIYPPDKAPSEEKK